MIKNLQDFLAGLLFLAFGIGFGWAATRHPLGSTADMGPGYFPLLMGLLLGLLGVLILFKALTFEALGGGRVAHWGLGSMLRVLGGLLWLVLCTGSSQWPWVGSALSGFPTFGLVIGVTGLLLAVALGGGARAGWWSLLLAVLVSAIWVGLLGLNVPLWPGPAAG
jgi:hypothetical protein